MQWVEGVGLFLCCVELQASKGMDLKETYIYPRQHTHKIIGPKTIHIISANGKSSVTQVQVRLVPESRFLGDMSRTDI